MQQQDKPGWTQETEVHTFKKCYYLNNSCVNMYWFLLQEFLKFWIYINNKNNTIKGLYYWM